MMLISDLSYFEDLPNSGCSSAGGAILAIDAVASASGANSLALTTTDITIKTIANGRGAIAKGKGSALAVGSDPYADASYYAEGFDKVKVKEKSGKGGNFAFDSIKVMAIDLPK